MRETTITLQGYGPASFHTLTRFEFGAPGARPHVHVQGGLHADEGPGMLAARMLADRLALLEREGRISGQVTVVPAANPIGLAQFVHGDQTGRFDLHDGRNFNRDYPDLTDDVARAVAPILGPDAEANAAMIRHALVAALETRAPTCPSDRLRAELMRMAVTADVVLDLHCDGEAEVHLYTQPASLAQVAPLAALLACRAVLVEEVSGGNPFDEALARPWVDLARRFPDVPIPQGCATCTVELRGRSDVSRDLGARDAEAILQYLMQLGAVQGSATLPDPLCEPTPLAGSEALVAPVAGLLSYPVGLGSVVRAGDTVAEITDLATGGVTPVRATTTGVFYARPATRIAEPNKRLGKVAGRTPFRAGPLLSP
jgi:predicted deacylase